MKKISNDKKHFRKFSYIFKKIETDGGGEFVNENFTDFLKKINFKRCSENTSLGAVFAGRYNESMKSLLKKPVFERVDANWVDILSTITKQYNNRVHTSTKLTPIQASLKKSEGFVYLNF